MTPEEVRRIVAIRNPVLRNLEITYAYSQLAAETARRTGQGANWCTFATWASRQAGRTIRGEDALGFVQERIYAAIILAYYIVVGTPVEGWTSLMIVVLVVRPQGLFARAR